MLWLKIELLMNFLSKRQNILPTFWISNVEKTHADKKKTYAVGWEEGDVYSCPISNQSLY